MNTARGWLRRVTMGLGAALAACGGGGDALPPPEQPAAVARVEVAPAAVLLPGAGATQTLRAQAYDADDRPLDVPVTWSSSRPAEVAVDGAGVASAKVAAGSAQITASAGGVTSAPALALAARPAAGVTLVADANIVGLPRDVDANAAPAASNRYTIALEGITAPAPGALLLSRGEKPLAGRVVAVQAMGAQTVVTMELVPLADLFAELQLAEVFDLTWAPVEIAPEIAATHDVVRSGNTWTFTPRPGATTTRNTPSSRSLRERRASTGVVGTHSRDILPFRSCEVGFAEFDGLSSLPLGLDGPPTMSLTLSPSYDVSYSRATGLQRLVVQAEPSVSMSAALQVTAQLTGEAKCKLQLFALRIPIAGPLAFFVGGMVPVGVGFDAELAGTLSGFKLGAANSAGMRVSAGIDCPAGSGCGFSASADNFGASLAPIVEVPSAADFRLEPKLDLFAYFEAEFGNPFLRSLRFKAIDTRIGARLQGSFAPPATQIAEVAYASSYGAALRASAKAGTGISDVVTLLGLGSLTQIAMAHEIPVAASPRVESALADRIAFTSGDTVNLRVTLDAATLDFAPGLYNVESVQIRRRLGSASQELLATQTAGSGQRVFDFAIAPSHSGDVSEWYAFVQTKLPGELLSLEGARVAAVGTEVLLLSGVVDAEGDCSARAEEWYEDDVTPSLNAEDRKDGESVNCLAVAGSARATASASASSSGPMLDPDTQSPRPIASFTGSGSASASAAGTVPSGSITNGWAAVGSADAEADGRWELRVQGQAVTMTITGSVADGAFSAEWAPSSGGLGVHGSYRLIGNEDVGAVGALGHSVRLEPGQTILVRASTHRNGSRARAAVEWDHDSTCCPGGSRSETANASYGFTVTFTP
jgi:hypothetical protein